MPASHAAQELFGSLYVPAEHRHWEMLEEPRAAVVAESGQAVQSDDSEVVVGRGRYCPIGHCAGGFQK